MASCNLNDWVKFELTQYGNGVLERYLKEQKEAFGCDARELYKPDSLGHIKLQLHEFMRVFGPSMPITFNNQLIVKNELIFTD